MKILHVVHQWNEKSLRGVELQVQGIIHTLNSKHQHTICTTQLTDKSEEEYTLNKNIIQKVAIYSISLKEQVNTAEWQNAHTTKIDAIFESILNKTKPDMVHIHHLKNLSLNIPFIAAKKNIPYIVSLYDYWFLCPKIQLLPYKEEGEHFCEWINSKKCSICVSQSREQHNLYWNTSRKILNNAQKVTVYSEYLKSRFTQFGIFPEKFTSIHYSFGTQRFLSQQKSSSDTCRFLFVGTIGKQKGFDLLLKSWKMFRKKYPSRKVSLEVIGATNAYKNVSGFLEEFEKSEGIPKEVIFRGEVPHANIHEVYANADYLIVPSIWPEPFPRVIVEAYLTHTPMIVSDISSLTENIPKIAYISFRRGNANALLEALGQAILSKHNIKCPQKFTYPFEHAHNKLDRLYEKEKRKGVSVIIPIREPSLTFYDALAAIENQDGVNDKEIIVIDSSVKSYKRSIEYELKKTPLKYIKIRSQEFNHGSSRDRAACFASGEFLVFLTQDAVPADNNWLKNLIAPCKKECVASHARQLPRIKAEVDETLLQDAYINNQPTPRISQITEEPGLLSPEEKNALLSYENISSCIRKDIWISYPFGKCDFGEDIKMAWNLLQKKFSIAYVPSAMVYHSHPIHFLPRLKRWFLSSKIKYLLLGLDYGEFFEKRVLEYLFKVQHHNRKFMTPLKSWNIAFAEVIGGLFGSEYAKLKIQRVHLNKITLSGKVTQTVWPNSKRKALFFEPKASCTLHMPRLRNGNLSAVIAMHPDAKGEGASLHIRNSLDEKHLLMLDKRSRKVCNIRLSSSDNKIEITALPYVTYDFLENFKNAEVVKKYDWPVDLATFPLKPPAEVLMQHPPSQIIYKDVLIPQNAVLSLSTGWHPKSKKNSTSTKLILRVQNEKNEFLHEEPPGNWNEKKIPLQKYAGEKVKIILESVSPLVFDFIKEFKSAKIQRLFKWPVAIAIFPSKGKVILEHPVSSISYNNIWIPKNAVISFETGMHKEAIGKNTQTTLTMTVIHKDGETCIFEREIDITWKKEIIALGEFSDQLVSIQLDSLPEIVVDLYKNFESAKVHSTHSWPVGRSLFKIKNKKVDVIMQHPPSSLQFRRMYVTPHAILKFGICLDDKTWNKTKGEGVRFLIKANKDTLFDKVINPKTLPEHRKIIEQSIALAKYADSYITLTLITEPEKELNIFNASGWHDVKIVYPKCKLQDLKKIRKFEIDPIGKNWVAWKSLQIVSPSLRFDDIGTYYPNSNGQNWVGWKSLKIISPKYDLNLPIKAKKCNDANWVYLINPVVVGTPINNPFEKICKKGLDKFNRWCIG